jgi:orotidine-5'-phosphate decarboxylase
LHFADRLSAAVAERQSQLVLGRVPDPHNLWPAVVEQTSVPVDGDAATVAQEVAAAFVQQCRLLIEAVGDLCVVIKPQLACFERLGAPGFDALRQVVQIGQAAGLLVLGDGKRGDVPVSAAAYAGAFFGTTSTPFGELESLGVDGLTVNPLLGLDAIEPLRASAKQADAGLFVLVRTSNPGADEFFDLQLSEGQQLLWEHLATALSEYGSQHVGECGLSDIAAVTGATAPQHFARMRELMPRTIFLLPGIGAQGGEVGAALAPVFSPGRAAGLVSASRSIAQAYLQLGGEPTQAARAEAQRLRSLTWKLVD